MPESISLPLLSNPFPQRRRDRWLDLNGEWRFASDPRDEGATTGWHLRLEHLPMQIVVPFCPESKASGLGIPDVPPIVWYGREIEFDPAWVGHRLLLHIGAADYLTRIWVNGTDLGTHRGGYSPFTIDVTGAVHGNRFLLMLRIEDHPVSSQPRGKQASIPEPHLIWYRRCTGIWRDVWLEVVPEQYLRSFHFMADWKRRELTLEAQGHRVDDTPLRFQAFREGELCFETMIPMNGGRVRAELDLSRFRRLAPWSLEDPVLYDIRLELGADVVYTYFGFRDIELESGRLHLNGCPMYLQLVLDQNYYPSSLYTEPEPGAPLREVELIREMAFNGVRKHQISPSPRFRYCCDALGLLILADMPGQTCDHPELGVPGLTADARANFIEEYTQLIGSNFNSPSIVGWTPYNESWGIYDVQSDASVQAWVRQIVELTRQLDPTRLVIGNDGWSAVETDLLALHHYAERGEELEVALTEWVQRKFDRYPPAHPAVATGCPDTGAPLFLSEYGGISYTPVEIAAGRWGYGTLETSADAFRARYRGLQETLRHYPELVGTCYTQLTDCELEINGLLTADRQPKIPLAEIRALNGLAVEPRRLAPEERRGERVVAQPPVSTASHRLPLGAVDVPPGASLVPDGHEGRMISPDNTPAPFVVRDCAMTAIATGRRAQTLKELRDILLTIHPGSIFYHFWGGLLQPRFEEREFNNDFAAWARHALHDYVLAERLAVIAPTEFVLLDELRQELIEIVEARLDEREYLTLAQPDHQFQFIRSQIVVFDTRKQVATPAELAALIPQLSSGSIFYHFIDSRRRTPDGQDDFRVWLAQFGSPYENLRQALAGVDPYFMTLLELRARLTALFQEYVGREK